MRWVCSILIASLLPGCGVVADAQNKERQQNLAAEEKAAFEKCEAQHPKPRSKQTPWTNCINEAETRISRASAPFPDLLDQRMAAQSLLAAQVDAGKLSLEEARLQLAKINTELTSEGERRAGGRRSVRAQETDANAAYRNSLGTTCTQIGNSVSCY